LKKKENEINACNAFIEILRRIKGVEYHIDSYPEDENRNSPDVEVILAPKDEDCQSPKIAVEHTIVDAHENQIRYVNQLDDIVTEIDRRCQEKLPTDHYFALTIPPSLVSGTKKEIKQLIEEMSDWILNIARTSSISQFDQFRKYVSRLYNGHEVWLTCGNPFSKLDIKVGMMPTRPKEIEKERQDRFRRAIEEKLPKLIKYKEKKYTTALLLEDVSFSHALPKDDWKDLIPNQYHSEFQLKIDYVVIFVSNKKKMIVGNVWKEGSQIYAEIPDNRKFSLRR
jgi:hypothetical protein